CFGTCKGQKHRNLASLTPSTDQSTHGVATEPPKQDDIEEPISLISESKVPLEEPTNCGDRKKVTFDLNVKTCEKLCTKEVINTLIESNEKKEREKKEEKAVESKSFSDLIASDKLSYPTNHRYQNCPDCEDEYEDIDLVESDFADDEEGEGGDNQTSVQEESSESMFSLSIDSRKHVSANETGEKEVNSPMPVHASSDKELKTIGLSAQDNWAVQAKALTTIKYQEKENINLEPYFNIATSPEKENTNLEPHFNRETSPEPSFKQSKRSLKPEFRDLKSAEHEVAVDTSLSSWLVESETTPKSSNSTNSVRNAPSEKLNSPRSHEDRPILGALTIEELRQYSASASPRWSRSRSPDDTPIIGTVGSYWSHTGQTMDSGSGSSGRGFTNTGSKKREDERMKWNSNPFEERLERV
ncbi:protein jason, partial [Quercus suber]